MKRVEARRSELFNDDDVGWTTGVGSCAGQREISPDVLGSRSSQSRRLCPLQSDF